VFASACARYEEQLMVARFSMLSIAFVILSLTFTAETARADECTASIASFALAGHGLSGKEAIYLATLNVDSDVTNAEFVVHFGATGPDVTFDTPVLHYKSSKVSGVSWLRLSPPAVGATISLASVTKFGETQRCIVSSAVPTPVEVFTGPETIYDDSKPHTDLSDVGYSMLARDSDFTKKAFPEYPYFAREENVMGEVLIEVEVGTQGGPAERAWVRWIEATGQSDLLEKPSLDAAHSSTFTAPVEDGRPTSRDYLILYTYSLDSPIRLAPDTFDGCPLEIEDARVAPPSDSDPNAWYFFNARAMSGKIASAVIAIQDTYGRIARYPWQPLTLTGPTIGRSDSIAAAAFNWSDTDVKGIWVDQVTTTSGSIVHCNQNIDEPKTLSLTNGLSRFMSGRPLDILGLEPMQHAMFTHEILPAYPTAADGTRAAGHVTVDTIVDSTGHVVDAFLTWSSGLDYLDAAAMKAAIASTYQPAAAGAVRAYGMTYRFVP